MEKTFGVLWGDRRAEELVRLFRQDGYTVSAYDGHTAETLQGVFGADILFLPVPLFDASGALNCPGAPMSAGELLSCLRPGQTVLAGQIPADFMRQAHEKGVALTDFMTESMTVANAALTADAALSLTLTETAQTLAGKRCLVLGFGRIGKILCQRLHGMGADVTAAARNPVDRAWIRALGFTALDTSRLSGHLRSVQVVYNTIPTPVLDAELLREFPPECFLMDLASRAGIDHGAASRLGLTCLWARGLPGRVFPRSAAVLLRDTAYHLLSK